MEPVPRKDVYVIEETLSPYDFDGNVSDIQKFVKSLVDRYGDDVTLDYGQHHTYDDSYTYNVLSRRKETDAEYEERCGSIAVGEAQREAKELDEYKRLQKSTETKNETQYVYHLFGESCHREAHCSRSS